MRTLLNTKRSFGRQLHAAGTQEVTDRDPIATPGALKDPSQGPCKPSTGAGAAAGEMQNASPGPHAIYFTPPPAPPPLAGATLRARGPAPPVPSPPRPAPGPARPPQGLRGASGTRPARARPRPPRAPSLLSAAPPHGRRGEAGPQLGPDWLVPPPPPRSGSCYWPAGAASQVTHKGPRGRLQERGGRRRGHFLYAGCGFRSSPRARGRPAGGGARMRSRGGCPPLPLCARHGGTVAGPGRGAKPLPCQGGGGGLSVTTGARSRPLCLL